MVNVARPPLIEWVRHRWSETENGRFAFLPVPRKDVFAALARETALIVSKHAACTPQVFMDGETARLLHEADKTWTLSAQVYVLGWLPTDVRNALNPSY
jgi:hypothetical protein